MQCNALPVCTKCLHPHDPRHGGGATPTVGSAYSAQAHTFTPPTTVACPTSGATPPKPASPDPPVAPWPLSSPPAPPCPLQALPVGRHHLLLPGIRRRQLDAAPGAHWLLVWAQWKTGAWVALGAKKGDGRLESKPAQLFGGIGGGRGARLFDETLCVVFDENLCALPNLTPSYVTLYEDCGPDFQRQLGSHTPIAIMDAARDHVCEQHLTGASGGCENREKHGTLLSYPWPLWPWPQPPSSKS